MTQANLIPSLQSDALAREIEQQLKDETGAVIATAERDARALIAQARAAARTRMHEAIQELRREGGRRLSGAKAQFETNERGRAQRQAAQAVRVALPLLREVLDARWRDERDRRHWTDGVARFCVMRLRPGAWLIEHPADWSEAEQRDFASTIGTPDGIDLSFKADDALSVGLRVKVDHAVARCHAARVACRRSHHRRVAARRDRGTAMSEAVIRWIGGPVLHARVTGDFRVGEAIEVGADRHPGEVIRLKDEELVGQVYEDTTGLRPGDLVHGTGAALSVRLGPNLLGHIFDGLLRPLDSAEKKDDATIAFLPLVKPGDTLTPGVPIGGLPGDDIKLQCLLPPRVGGTVEFIAAEGAYPSDATLCTVKDAAGATHDISFFQRWPIRQARPVAERLPADEPMVTGQRILDTLFPVARGGQAAIPGGFGTGKTVLQETLAKWCDADVIVYVGCGERGNEMAEVLREFPKLSDPRNGRGLMERTVIIANTSNMPVAAREASIYTAVTIGEYFRDQGLHVALMADRPAAGPRRCARCRAAWANCRANPRILPISAHGSRNSTNAPPR